MDHEFLTLIIFNEPRLGPTGLGRQKVYRSSGFLDNLALCVLHPSRTWPTIQNNSRTPKTQRLPSALHHHKAWALITFQPCGLGQDLNWGIWGPFPSAAWACLPLHTGHQRAEHLRSTRHCPRHQWSMVTNRTDKVFWNLRTSGRHQTTQKKIISDGKMYWKTTRWWDRKWGRGTLTDRVVKEGLSVVPMFELRPER